MKLKNHLTQKPIWSLKNLRNRPKFRSRGIFKETPYFDPDENYIKILYKETIMRVGGISIFWSWTSFFMIRGKIRLPDDWGRMFGSIMSAKISISANEHLRQISADLHFRLEMNIWYMAYVDFWVIIFICDHFR